MAMSVAGAGLQAYGAYRSSKAQQAAYNYNAQVGELQAQASDVEAADALARGEQAVTQHRQQVSQLKGRQRAVLAANGVDLGEGSALNILTDTDVMGEYDANIIRQNAEREAYGHRKQAWAYRSGATLDRFGADSQSPLLAGTSTLLSGAGSVASQWYSFKTAGAIK